MQHIHIQVDFPFSLENLFQYLKKHENFNELFAPAKVQTIQKGQGDDYGVGSVRRLSIFGLVQFEETIVSFQENALIEYKITKGTPLKNHHGKMVFAAKGAGSSLDYSIQFESAVPFLAYLVKQDLQKSISKGLKGLQKRGL